MNIDDMEGLDEATKTQIAAWQKVTREKDGGDTFAKAQFNIGSVYHENNKLESALKAWNKIKRSDNLELYSKLRVDIGTVFKELDDAERALIEWKKVERLDNAEAYARAQFYTGSVLKENKNNEEAIIAWSGIERLDHPDLYARAKLSIGIALLEQQDIEGALMAWRSIKRSDSLEAYASAQINISNRLKLSNDIEGALAVLGKIKREDDLKAFAHAQFNIGAILKERGNNESALEIWSNITRLDNLETYAKAQFNIGVVLHNSNNLEGAVLAWSSIEKSDDREIYVSAQYSIALILKTKGDSEGALIAFNNVERSDNSKIYAQAQVNVGWIFDENKNTIGALEAWNNVQPKDDKEAYALAQYSIAVILSADAGSNKNIDIWQNVAFLEDPDIFIYSQYNLGKSFIDDNFSKSYIQDRKAFENAEIAYPYEANCYKKICDLFENIENHTIGNLFLEFFEKTMSINEILKIDFDGFSEDEKSPERKLAHYTGTDTTNKLLDIEKGKERPSSFRLNTVNNVNDPSEGQLLLNELRGIRKVSFAAPDFDEKLHAFISCFTFNHDSLNQFRLYGKENNKEASGISLVFNKYFFQECSYVGGLSYVSFEETLQTIVAVSAQKDIKVEVLPKQNNGVIKRLQKQPVMRCVYLDPTSGYIQLAQRNRLTFFREFADENFEYQDSRGFKREVIWAEVEWEKYKFEIEEKTKSFEKAFKELKVIYVKINEEKIKFENANLKILNDIKTLLNEILLPLKYLIKHSAFQEEQECRMIYITSLKDPKVKMDFGKFLYVEYETDVKTHLNKIYIAPAATQYQPYLAKLLCDTSVKIELSNNPYRQT